MAITPSEVLVERTSRRGAIGARRTPHRSIVAAITAAWALAIVAQAVGANEVLHHDALIHSGLPLWIALVLFILAWQAMIAAMMMPSALPLIALFDRIGASQPRFGQARAAFLGGYAAVWTAFGALAFLGDIGLHRLVGSTPWLADRPRLISGGALLLAGAFQFSDLKERCLSECRMPAQYLTKHYRRGVRAAFRLGAGHGVFCVGCCWALMLVGFAAGVANLWWMAALTLLMVVEKTVRWGDRVVVPAGVAFLVLGAGTMAFPFLNI